MNKNMKKFLMALVLTMGVVVSVAKPALAVTDPGDEPRPASIVIQPMSSDPGDEPRP